RRWPDMRSRIINALLLLFTVFAAAALAAPDPQAANPSASAGEQAAPAAAYKYSGDGRRDPFVSLVGTGGDSKVPAKRTGEGLAAMRVEEVAVRGIVQSRERLVAMVQG